MLLSLMLLQPAPDAAPVTAAPPDIQIGIVADVDRVTVTNRGYTSLTVTASPDAGSQVRVDVPRLPQGQRRLHDVRLEVDARVRIGDPAAPASPAAPEEQPQEPASPN